VAAASAALCGFAQTASAERPPDAKGTLTLVAENDSLSSGADRNYTNGVKISYVAPLDVMPKWVRGLDNLTESITGARPSLWGVSLGQSIFTPEDIAAVPAPGEEHPYAGWLYLQLMMAAEEIPLSDDSRFIDIYELEFGMVGPAALGRQAQRGVHQLLDAPDPKGWESQLKDEPAFAASVERRWRARPLRGENFGRVEADVTPGVGLTLGTLRTEAKAGAVFRIGQGFGRDYGPPRVRPALAGIGHFEADQAASWYVFAGVDLRAVGRNLFLDGNTWRDGPRVDRNPFVADLQAGAAVQLGDVRLVYTYVTRTQEFESQGGQQDFGVMAVSWRF
jgi:hypothetical protein